MSLLAGQHAPLFLGLSRNGKPPPPFVPPLAAGVRAGPSTVGYFPEYGPLTVYNIGDTPPSGWVWSGDVLQTNQDNATLNLAEVNASLYCIHSNPTITKCVIHASIAQLIVITLQGTAKGTLTVHDCTVLGNREGAFNQYQLNGISSDSAMDVRRNYVAHSGDGIHFTGRTGTLISQCYVGPLRFTDEDQHLDGIQHFQDSTPGSYTIEHSYVAYTQSQSNLFTLQSMSAGITQGPPASTGALYTPTINNNFIQGGGYHLRFNYQARDCVVTNNDFGPIHFDEAGYHDFNTGAPENLTYTTWSNNRNELGQIIPAP